MTHYPKMSKDEAIQVLTDYLKTYSTVKNKTQSAEKLNGAIVKLLSVVKSMEPKKGDLRPIILQLLGIGGYEPFYLKDAGGYYCDREGNRFICRVAPSTLEIQCKSNSSGDCWKTANYILLQLLNGSCQIEKVVKRVFSKEENVKRVFSKEDKQIATAYKVLGYNYVATDGGGQQYVYEHKPCRNKYGALAWNDGGTSSLAKLKPISFVCWEDAEPTKLDDIINS